MGGNVRFSGRKYDLADKSRHHAERMRRARARDLHDTGYQFDIDGWVALLEEQRLRIARAAGVDPSKVSIQIGH